MSTQTNAPESEGLTSADAELFERAREAVMRLRKRTFEDWVTIGHAVARAREIADARGGRQAFKRLLDQQGLAGTVGDKATSTRLLAIMAELPKVTEWRETLTVRQQVDWSAPTTIFRHCPVFQKPKAEGEKPPTRMEEMGASIARLEDENMTLKKKLAQSDGSLFDLRNDAVADIAATIVRTISPSKAGNIARAIVKAIKEKAAHAG